MADVTRLLNAVANGDPQAGAELLPLVYGELRKLASARMNAEQPNHTLQPTALVHEAYLRLVGDNPCQPWNGRGHFFAAAAEAMRRILVEQARRKRNLKQGGEYARQDVDPRDIPVATCRDPLEILAVHDGLEQLARKYPRKAELVKLRYFLGCTMPEAAEILEIAVPTAEEDWTYAKAWLRRLFHDGEDTL